MDRKRCPRCGGRVLLNRDYHGWYEECLQCGHMHDLKVLARPRHSAVERKREVRSAGIGS